MALSLSDYRINGDAIEYIPASNAERLADYVHGLSIVSAVLAGALALSLTWYAAQPPACSSHYSDLDRKNLTGLISSLIDNGQRIK